MEEELVTKIDMIQETLSKETLPWRRTYLYQRFFHYFARIRQQLNQYLLPSINCKHHNVNRSRIPLLTALLIWRENPQDDICACDLQQSIFLWMEKKTNVSRLYMIDYKQLRKTIASDIMAKKHALAKTNPIYELMVFSTIVWCDSTQSYIANEVHIMLSLVRGYCSQLRFSRAGPGKQLDQMSPCEQWHELVQYIISLLEVHVVVCADDAITLCNKLDWTGKFSTAKVLTIIEHPEFWLKRKFELQAPVELQFDYFAWLQQNHDSLDKLPTPDELKYNTSSPVPITIQKKCHIMLSALTLSLWIISRLSHWVIMNTIQ